MRQSCRDYVNDWSQYSVVLFKDRTDPDDGWAMPYITNHTYKINWGFGLDFTSMRLTLSSRWTYDDLPINLMFNFTDVRAAVYMDTGNDVIANDTLKHSGQWTATDRRQRSIQRYRY